MYGSTSSLIAKNGGDLYGSTTSVCVFLFLVKSLLWSSKSDKCYQKYHHREVLGICCDIIFISEKEHLNSLKVKSKLHWLSWSVFFTLN